jgi:hypothetical protein
VPGANRTTVAWPHPWHQSTRSPPTPGTATGACRTAARAARRPCCGPHPALPPVPARRLPHWLSSWTRWCATWTPVPAFCSCPTLCQWGAPLHVRYKPLQRWRWAQLRAARCALPGSKMCGTRRCRQRRLQVCAPRMHEGPLHKANCEPAVMSRPSFLSSLLNLNPVGIDFSPASRRAATAGGTCTDLCGGGGHAACWRRTGPRTHAGFLWGRRPRGLLHDWSWQSLVREHGPAPHFQPRLFRVGLWGRSLHTEMLRPGLRPLPVCVDAAASSSVPGDADWQAALAHSTGGSVSLSQVGCLLSIRCFQIMDTCEHLHLPACRAAAPAPRCFFNCDRASPGSHRLHLYLIPS